MWCTRVPVVVVTGVRYGVVPGQGGTGQGNTVSVHASTPSRHVLYYTPCSPCMGPVETTEYGIWQSLRLVEDEAIFMLQDV